MWTSVFSAGYCLREQHMNSSFRHLMGDLGAWSTGWVCLDIWDHLRGQAKVGLLQIAWGHGVLGIWQNGSKVGRDGAITVICSSAVLSKSILYPYISRQTLWNYDSYSFYLRSQPKIALLPYHGSLLSLLSFFLRFYLFIFRDRGRGAERRREKHHCVVASCAPPTRDLACNPGNQAGDPLVCRLALNPRSHTSQGSVTSFLSVHLRCTPSPPNQNDRDRTLTNWRSLKSYFEWCIMVTYK